MNSIFDFFASIGTKSDTVQKVESISTTINNAVDSISRPITKLSDAITGITESVDKLEKSLATIATSADAGASSFDKLAVGVAAANTTATALDAAITAKSTGIDISNITTRVIESLATISTALDGFFKAIQAKMPILGVFATKIAAATGAVIGFGKALIANPIGIAVAAVAGLIAIFTYFWKTNEDFRDGVINAWNAIKDFLEPVVTSIKNLIETVFGGIRDFIDRNGDEIREIFSKIWDGIVTLVDIKLGPLIEWFSSWLGGIESTCEDRWNIIKNIFAAVFDIISVLFESLFIKLQGIWDLFAGLLTGDIDRVMYALGDILRSHLYRIFAIIGILVELGKDIIQGMWNGMKKRGAFFIGWIVGFFKAIITYVKRAFGINSPSRVFAEIGTNIIEGLISTLKNLPDKAIAAISSLIDKIREWGAQMLSTAKEKAQSLVSNVTDIAQRLPQKFRDAINSAIDKIREWGSQMLSTAKEKAQSLVSNVTDIAQRLPQKFRDSINSAIDKVRDWGRELITKARQGIEDMRTGIISAAQSIPNDMLNIGESIVRGVWNGIQGAVSWFTNNVTGFFSDIVGSAKRTLGINSPSKVFQDIGNDICRGFIKGIAEMDNAVNKAMDDTFGNLDRDVNVLACTSAFAGNSKMQQSRNKERQPIVINIQNEWYVNDEIDIDSINRAQARRIHDTLRGAGFAEI
ncbi:MAG: hypothetical protein FWC91_00430 [Defluviitaleaceae bacterium]|nr:hypothetical protein [Defluviitaleaceae bacterium]